MRYENTERLERFAAGLAIGTIVGLGLAVWSLPACGAEFYTSAGLGMTNALDKSNDDRTEFGSEPGISTSIEIGKEYDLGDGFELRIGAEGIYAPKDLHGRNTGKGDANHHSADGQTLQSGALLPSATLLYSFDEDFYAFGRVGAGPGFRSDDAVTYAYSSGLGAGYNIDESWSIEAGYRYTDIGGFDYHGPEVRAVFKW